MSFYNNFFRNRVFIFISIELCQGQSTTSTTNHSFLRTNFFFHFASACWLKSDTWVHIVSLLEIIIVTDIVETIKHMLFCMLQLLGTILRVRDGLCMKFHKHLQTLLSAMWKNSRKGYSACQEKKTAVEKAA